MALKNEHMDDDNEENKSIKHNPEQIIEDLGGCGRYQIRMVVVTHFIKSAVCFGYLTSLVATKTPPWRCDDQTIDYNTSFNGSDLMMKSCRTLNETACETFSFTGTPTIVSQFALVCDDAYIPGLIMSIQALGMLIGNPLGGQVADQFGRKLPYFSGILLIGIATFVAYFSTSWELFLICRIFVGIGNGFFMTVQYNLMSEFTLAKYRPWIVGFPSWQVQSCVWALFGWLIDDWKALHLFSAATCILCLAGWWVIPESFRWYIAHERFDDARRVVETVAKVNSRKVPSYLSEMRVLEEQKDKSYTFRDLFRTRYLVKVSLLSALNWSALGLVAYGLAYQIQALSGNVYLNMFLFALTSMPIKLIVSFLLNRIGRRRSNIAAFAVSCLGGLVAAVLQHIDTPHRGVLTNASAMVANMGIQAAWGTVQTTTVEVYPTVIRNIGFGTLSTVARITGAIGPQIVFLDIFLPGLMFLVCGVLSFLCMIGSGFLPETADANLLDKIQQKQEQCNDDTSQNVVI